MKYLKSSFLGIILFAYAALWIAPQRWKFISPLDRRHARLAEELMAASEAGDLKSISNSLDGGADINSANKLGITPLIIAAAKLKEPAVKLLLSRGADSTLKTKQGFTAYDFVKDRDQGLAELLK